MHAGWRREQGNATYSFCAWMFLATQRELHYSARYEATRLTVEGRRFAISQSLQQCGYRCIVSMCINFQHCVHVSNMGTYEDPYELICRPEQLSAHIGGGRILHENN